MQKLLLPLVMVSLWFSGFAQKANKKYVDGIVYFQVKANAHITVKCDAKGHTNLKDFSFIGPDAFAKYGITHIDKSFHMAKDEKLLRTYKVFFSKIYDVEKLIKDLQKLNVVEYAEKLPVYKLSYVPNDPIYSQTTGSGTATMHFNWPLTRINAPAAWGITKGSAAIKVAVVDNGIYVAHPDLTNKIVAQYDVADLDNDPTPPATATGSVAYEWSHGTHVSGLVGAQSDNGIGVASIGFSVSLVAVKIAQDATGNITAGYEGVTWASTTGGANVINMSWGGYGSATTAQNVITAAYNQGCVLVAAAGNNGDGGEDPTNTNGILYPAAYTECIAVAATNSDDTKASFSEYGSWVDVCAPGGNEAITGWSSPYVTPLISTTFCTTYGMNAYYGLSNSLFGVNANYDGMQGTSMASPLVAGLAGLIWSVNPTMTKVQVRNCITSTADNISAANSGTPALTGNIGSGRINAFAAVQCAQSTASVAPTPAFEGSPLSICPGSVVSFTNQTVSASAVSYTWAFQGGTPATSTQTNVSVTYNTPGVYSVTLTATNIYGTNSTVQTAYVNVIGAAAVPLIEGFQSSTFAPTNWYLVDAGSDGRKWSLSTTAGQASTQSAYFDNYNDAANAGYRDELRTFVNLSGYNTAKMTFYRSYSATFGSPNIDTLQIGVSTNCGTSVTSAYMKGGPALATAVTSNTAAAFTPTSNAQWVKDSIDLSAYVGQTSVMVSFINRGHYGDDIYLDNINITGIITPAPTATMSMSSSTICAGQALSLTNTSTGSPTNYTWTMPGGSPSSATTSSTSVIYSTAGVKTISLTVATGTLSSTSTKTVTVVASPTIIGAPTASTICSGQFQTLTASGGSTYSWAPGGQTTASVSVNPSATTVYTVTGTTSGCSSSQIMTVTVNTTPTVNISGPSSACSGNAVALSATGAGSYVWAPGGQTSASVSVNPSSTTVYTVTGTTTGCSATTTTTLTVGTTPTITATPASSTICSGQFQTLTASGASTYSWAPGGQTTASVSVNPSATTIYSVTGTTGGCSATKVVTLSVNTTPTVNISGPAGICIGGSAVLSAAGAPSITWAPGGQTTTSVTVNPASTTVYTVTGTSAGCSAVSTKTLTVTPTPTITINTTNTTVCSGSSVSLTASGATSYTWNPGGVTNATDVVSPGTTTTYTVTGSTGGCNATNSSVVGVLSSPTINAAASATAICTGQSATLSATGASSYTWNPGGLTGANVVVSPASTTTYSVSGTNGSSCAGNAMVMVNITVCTGIEALNSNTAVSIYPNPNTGEFNIVNGSSQPFNMIIYNSIGQVVVSERLSKEANKINISSFGKGVYYVQLSNNDFTKTVKLIVE